MISIPEMAVLKDYKASGQGHLCQSVDIVEGNRRNIKITTREDLLIANSFLKG